MVFRKKDEYPANDLDELLKRMQHKPKYADNNSKVVSNSVHPQTQHHSKQISDENDLEKLDFKSYSGPPKREKVASQIEEL